MESLAARRKHARRPTAISFVWSAPDPTGTRFRLVLPSGPRPSPWLQIAWPICRTLSFTSITNHVSHKSSRLCATAQVLALAVAGVSQCARGTSSHDALAESHCCTTRNIHCYYLQAAKQTKLQVFVSPLCLFSCTPCCKPQLARARAVCSFSISNPMLRFGVETANLSSEILRTLNPDVISWKWALQ